MILKNLHSLEVQLSATFKILTLKLERRVLKLFCMLWILKFKFQEDPLINLSTWLFRVPTVLLEEVQLLVVLSNKVELKLEIQLNSTAITNHSNHK